MASVFAENMGDGSALYVRWNGVLEAHENNIYRADFDPEHYLVRNDNEDPIAIDAAENWWGKPGGMSASDKWGLVDDSDHKTSPATTPSVSISFPYARGSAALHAINESRDNFANFPVGNGNTRGPVVGTVGGAFTYPATVLDHITGSNTGSAIFISECLHAGGLPMIYGLINVDEVDTSGCSQDTGSTTSGWRVCSGALGATDSWKGHQALLNYLLANGGSQIGDTNNPEEDPPSLSIGEVAPYINYTTGEVGNAQALYDLFNTGGEYATVQTGDYIFINQGTLGAHGFLIVGWGAAADIPESVNGAVDGESDTGSRQVINLSKVADTVPYIVDFAYGYDGVATGWLQDVRPRPFYVSAANNSLAQFDAGITGYSAGDYEERLRGAFSPFVFEDVVDCNEEEGPNYCRPAWQFYHVPDYWVIPSGRLYNVGP